ncbi:MAG: hypothetical protein JWM36_3220 [Hyphomicrobiales bacterium]|nr:hypothetical protein [Hyphomicrobiales bacterium]
MSFFNSSQSVLASVWAAIRPGTEAPAADDSGLAAPHTSLADEARVRDALAVVTAAAAPIVAALGAGSSSLDAGTIEEVRAAAISAERQRCSDILRSDAAKGRMPLALHAAFGTNMSAAESIGIISMAPLEQAAAPAADPLAGLSPLDRHMTRLGIVVAPVAQPKPPVVVNLSNVYAERAAAVGPGRTNSAGSPPTREQAPQEATSSEIYASRAAATARANADDLARRPKVRGESDDE